MLGVGYADATLRKFQVSEFTDNDQFSNLEVRLVKAHAIKNLLYALEVVDYFDGKCIFRMMLSQSKECLSNIFESLA